MRRMDRYREPPAGPAAPPPPKRRRGGRWIWNAFAVIGIATVIYLLVTEVLMRVLAWMTP